MPKYTRFLPIFRILIAEKLLGQTHLQGGIH